ncbi:MAG: heme-binding protein [Betaproteobacteria bacterium]|nr:heme-binding protein [Betaproteobacteria bacterium]
MSVQRTISQVSSFLVFALFTGIAPAQAQSYGSNISTDQAKKIAAGAVAECQKNNWRTAVAIVDTGGALVYFERIDDTQVASLKIAIDKAYAAATYRRPTRVWEGAMAKGRIAVITLAGVVASPGGVPIVSGGKVIGAVGVSGATGDQDEQCAKAGLAAM